MHKKLIIFGLIGIGCVALVTWFCFGIGDSLSGSDILAIRKAVRHETAEAILEISGTGKSTATVTTGRRGNGLSGGGHTFYMNRTVDGWQIVRRDAWMS